MEKIGPRAANERRAKPSGLDLRDFFRVTAKRRVAGLFKWYRGWMEPPIGSHDRVRKRTIRKYRSRVARSSPLSARSSRIFHGNSSGDGN